MINSFLFQRLKKAIDHPDQAFEFVIWKIKEKFLWDYYYKTIRDPKRKSSGLVIDNESITLKLRKEFNIVDFKIDVDDYKQFMFDADYAKVQSYYGVGGKHNCFKEVTLEHYLAAKFLNLKKDDV